MPQYKKAREDCLFLDPELLPSAIDYDKHHREALVSILQTFSETFARGSEKKVFSQLQPILMNFGDGFLHPMKALEVRGIVGLWLM